MYPDLLFLFYGRYFLTFFPFLFSFYIHSFYTACRPIVNLFLKILVTVFYFFGRLLLVLSCHLDFYLSATMSFSLRFTSIFTYPHYSLLPPHFSVLFLRPTFFLILFFHSLSSNRNLKLNTLSSPLPFFPFYEDESQDKTKQSPFATKLTHPLTLPDPPSLYPPPL